MEKKSLVVNGQPQNAHAESMLIVEQFLQDHYLLRRNMLSGKVEFKKRANEKDDYRPLTQEALNSIIIHALREGRRAWSVARRLRFRCTSILKR